MKNKMITMYRAVVLTAAGLFSTGQVGACDFSGFTLTGVTSLGSNKYKLDVTFCAGAGRNSNRYGADQGTTNFAFYLSMNAKLDTFSHDTLISPVTGDVFHGYKLVDNSKYSVPYNADVLYYLDWNSYPVWTCIDYSCGAARSVCKSISIITIGLPDTVWLRGMEAAGNIMGGCTNLRIFPKCYNSTLAANAGGDQTVYLGAGPSCATLNGTASSGVGSYSYAWSTGATTSSISVCPTANSNYTLTVTDGNGCKSTDQVTVTYKDIRCGKNKVNVCYKSKTQCVSTSNVGWYTSRGATLGACGSAAYILPNQNSAIVTSLEMSLFPNPAKGVAYLSYIGSGTELELKLYTATGQNLGVIYKAATIAGENSIAELNIEKLPAGIYVIRAESINLNAENLQSSIRLVVE